MEDSLFAEIDIEPAQGPAFPKDEVMRSKVMHPAWTEALSAQPIAPRAPDPVRERFYEMRRLASKPPFPKSTSELFYRQARFMEDFEDDYEGDTPFNMYFPCYQQMGYDYLRTYFTWRTKVRGGRMPDTSLSYIFLYIYELLSGIGVQNPAEGLAKLFDVWNAFSKKYSAIEEHLPKWFKDYYVFYEMPYSFIEFIEEYSLQKYYSLTLMFDIKAENQLEVWNSISSYNAINSKFCKDGNKELMEKCFEAVIAAIGGFCESKGSGLENLLVYSVSRRTPWRPFKNALFGSNVQQRNREVVISKYERYFCRNNQWTANLPIYYSTQRDFVGYILKKTEACLRNESGYKYKLAVEMRRGYKPFLELKRTAANRAQLDRVITKAVEEFYRDINRVVVTVDHKSLSRIREEALETQEQLIVDDEAFSDSAGVLPDVDEGTLEAENETNVPGVVDTGADGETETLTLSFSDGWEALRKALTDTEREALRLALRDDESGGAVDIKSFAAKNGIMLEVLLDEINAKASECIGDSIMELTDEVYVFEEYKAYLSDML